MDKMEVDTVIDQKFPFDLWRKFKSMFTFIMDEEADSLEEHAKIMREVLSKMGEQEGVFSPFLTYKSNAYSVDSYKEFTIWIVGQLVKILSHSGFFPLHSDSIHSQTCLLEVLSCQNTYIYDCAISDYSEFITKMAENIINDSWPIIISWYTPEKNFQTQLPGIDLTSINISIHDRASYVYMLSLIFQLFSSNVFSLNYVKKNTAIKFWKSIALAIHNSHSIAVTQSGLNLILHMLVSTSHRQYFDILESIYVILFDTIEKVCSTYNNTDKANEIQIILSNIFDNLREVGSINSIVINMAIIDLSSKLLLCQSIKVSNKLSEAMCNLIKALLDREIVKPDIIIEKLPMNQLMNLVTSPGINVLFEFFISQELKVNTEIINEERENENLFFDDEKNNFINVVVSSSLWCQFWKNLNQTIQSLTENLTTKEFHVINTTVCLAHYLDMTLTIKYHKLLPDLNTDKLVFKLMNYVLNHVDCLETLETLFITCGSLVCLNEFSSFSTIDAQTLIAILSLPWMSISNSLFKHLPLYECINAVSKKCSSLLNEIKIMQKCLSYICHIKSNIFFNWRENIIFTSLNNPYVCEIAIQKLPFLFYKKTNQNISTLLETIEQFDETISILFTKNLRILLCAMYGKTIEQNNTISRQKELFCVDCDQNKVKQGLVDDTSLLDEVYKTNLNEFWKILLFKFVNSSSTVVRCEVIKNIPMIINHHYLDGLFRNQMLILINDKNEEVRIQCSKVLNFIIFEKDSSGSYQIVESYFSHMLSILCSTVNTSLKYGNNELQYTCLETIFNVGCVPVELTILPTMEFMFLFLIHPNSYYGSIAKFYMTEIAAAHKSKFLVIFDRYETELMQYIANNLVACYDTYNIDVKKTYNKLGFTHRDMYAIKQIVKYIFPWCIKKPKTRKILNEIASISQKNESTLLKESFKYCFSHLLLSEDKDICKEGFQLLEKITNTSLVHSVRLSYTPIIAEILIHFHSKHYKATEAMKILQTYDVLFKVENYTSIVNFADFLSPRFLGLLMILESRLVKNAPDSIKENILLSLGDIFKLMGSRFVTPARFKILAMLRTAISLKNSTFVYLGLKAWDSFIHCVHMEALGPMLSTIFVSLMPLIDIYPNKVANIFYFTVKENEQHLKNHIAELYFLDPHPASPIVFDIVQQYTKHKFDQPLNKLLTWLLDIVAHKTLEVRLHGLERLHSELSAQQSEVTKLILSSDNVNSVIIKLIELLTENLRHQDKKVRLASSECLGKIGALDPSYLPNNVIKEGRKKEFPLDIESNDFAIRALTVLGQGLQSARNSRYMDSFAVAIQQILQVYNVKKDSDIWLAIPSTLHEIIDPLSSSRYTLETEQYQTGMPHPIFGSAKSGTLNSWAYNWVNRLVPLINDENAKRTFTYCKSSIRSDNDAMLLFLPYVLLYAILSANSVDGNLIYEELLAVISNDIDDSTTNITNIPETSEGILDGRQIALEYQNNDSSEQQNETTTRVMYVKTAFTLFDFLFKWTREQKASKNTICEPVTSFLIRFCKLKLAKKSLEFDEYARALLYLEDYIHDNKDKLQEHLPTLSRIYSKLNDADSLKGIIAAHNNDPSPQEMILLHEVNGQLQDAAACYEQLAQMYSDPSLEFHKGMVKCYLGIDQPFTALKIAEGLTNIKSDCKNKLFGEKAEATWSLMMFDQLKELLTEKPLNVSESWGVCVGQALVHFLNKDKINVHNEIFSITNFVTESLYMSMVGSAGYKEAYPYIVKLHILNEMKQIFSIILKIVDGDACAQIQLNNLITSEMNERLQCLQPQAYVLQQVLCMRRVVLTAAQNLVSDELKPIINHQIGISWLKSIKVARKSLNFQQAYSNILAAEKYKPIGLFIEKAKLLWKKSDQGQAIATLKKGINMLFPNLEVTKTLPCDEKIEERKTCASALLLLSKYNDKTVNVDLESNLLNIENAYEMFGMWEKSLVRFAHYQDRILNTMTPSIYYTKGLNLINNIVNCYGLSLQYGCEYIYQSMPKMLSVWLDFGSDINRDLKKKNNKMSLYLTERKRTFIKMTKLIEGFVLRLPTFMFLTAFSQITSRICHPLEECFSTLTDIIVKCILDYPNHSLWMLMTLHKSPFTVRVNRFNSILKHSKLSKVRPLLNQFMELFENLSELCNTSSQNAPVGVKFPLQKIAKSLPRLLTNGYFSNIMVPAQKFRTLVLPRINTNRNTKHNPFPDDLVYIHGIKDEVYIYSSLQKPKRIIIIGSDGNEYPMMCKPKDDMRIDSRLMEFNNIVNMYLKRDPEARDRSLYIKTYSVVPMILDCGLIELVQNVVTMRSVILNCYEAIGIKVSKNTLQGLGLICNIKDSLEKKKSVFLNKAIPNHPPVFRNWYLKEFPSPGEWYIARSEFTRTTAVMSIVGYILGLGDRHGENILLDSTNGGVVHVDFNCLFNRGEKFEWPERVPFRMTHNMVDAMGTGGLEGMLSSACEITNRVMRSHTEQLISVLKPFLYDPLVMWTGRDTKADENSEMTNNQAQEHLNNIEMRLQGYVRANLKNSSMPLSVAGQTRNLIEEAISIDNLCQMYIGWSAFL